MLQLKHIKKEYKTGDLIQKALDDVSLNLRDNEFVAILGPSGSGKTTLLNIIGGLDRYDSGDLIINGVSTKKYTDRDWDSYRNHTIGFVFQSYNLIPHQTVLSNVELALTISGISGAERRSRAAKALEQVGLGDQLHKHPSEMSGGQMQRVAIARALVNNPDILLADEPTGALDSETSLQVMELLKEVAKDRLVGDKVIALEHETNGVVAVGVPVAVGVLPGGDAVDDQVTAIIAVKAANDVEQCGFAGAAGAQDGDKFIVTEVQADIVEGDLFQIACFVFLADFFKLKHIPAFLGNGPEPDACFRPCKPGCPEVCRTCADRKITR